MSTSPPAPSAPARARRPRFQLTAAQRYERELVALEDAGRLAQLWEHALRASFDLGRASGYQAGWLAGRDEEAAAWQAIVTGYSEVISQPRHDELVRLREPSNDPCAARCGWCSSCIHAEHVQANLARYGQPDFPGVDQPAGHTDPRPTEVAS